MSVDWANLGQVEFDRTVEALVRHRFGERARAINGRGGDDGRDIEVTFDDGRVWILQLKYFPEGFSSEWRKRRTQIRNSFQAALAHTPAEWTLVVPCLCTKWEHKYVADLNKGEVPPKITVVDRDDLDAWTADAPEIDKYVQRTATSELQQMARDFGQEQAALLGGISDIAARVGNLGSLVNAVDLDWAVDFAHRDDTTELLIRPKHADAPLRSPIGFTVEIDELSDEHSELKQQLMRNIGYATSETTRIPQDVVRSVRFDGPEFIAGEYPPGAVELLGGPRGPAVGQPLGIRALDEGAVIASYEGRITHSASGEIGGSIEAAFCDSRLEVRLRVPHDVESIKDSSERFGSGVDLELNYGPAPPSAIVQTLSTRRVMRYAPRLEAHFNGDLLMAFRLSDVSESDQDYEADLMAIEQFAYDLDVVQRHTGQFFDIPEYMHPRDRINIRVARLLIEGFIVASPRAPVFTMRMNGNDTPQVRAVLRREPQSIVWPAGPHRVTLGDRELTIGDVYAVHPAATAVNVDEALAALEAGEADGFEVELRPGDDPYFNLTLANAPSAEVMRRSLAQWTLWGIDQTGVPDGNWSLQAV